VWLFFLLLYAWPRDCARRPHPAAPIAPRRQRSDDPIPFAGLTQKPVVFLVATDNAGGYHRVKCPYFTTVNRGPRHGIQSIVLPIPAGCSRLDLPAPSCRIERPPTVIRKIYGHAAHLCSLYVSLVTMP
jgi:hypothetical protein